MESAALGFDDMTLVEPVLVTGGGTLPLAAFALPSLLEIGVSDPGGYRPPTNGTSGSSPVFSTPISCMTSQVKRDAGEEDGSQT